jgi:ketosteroid isomerase-like protein
VLVLRHMDHEPLLRDLYDAFNRRDIERAVAAMRPDVDWPNAFEGGRIVGREGVRDYWTRQFAQIDPNVEPVGFSTDADGRVAVAVQQLVRTIDGEVLADRVVTHVYAFREGLVERMDVIEPDD